jgi:hypothetical protein
MGEMERVANGRWRGGFPLTPALSLGEREKHSTAADESDNVWN